jgi:predicted Rossmann-fold nucleotide-binding protein
LLSLFDHAQAEGFLRPAFRRLVLTADEPEELLAAMEQYAEPAIERWLTRQAL